MTVFNYAYSPYSVSTRAAKVPQFSGSLNDKVAGVFSQGLGAVENHFTASPQNCKTQSSQALNIIA